MKKKAPAKSAKHMDVAQDKKLIAKMIKKSEKKDVKEDKAMIKKAFKLHDQQRHEGKPTNLSKLKCGGKAK